MMNVILPGPKWVSLGSGLIYSTNIYRAHILCQTVCLALDTRTLKWIIGPCALWGESRKILTHKDFDLNLSAT